MPTQPASAAAPLLGIFLVLLGVSSGVIGFAMDSIVHHALEIRNAVVIALNKNHWFTWEAFAFHVGVTVFFTLLAVLATRLAPEAAGSGIPEMKAVLSGVVIDNLLAGRTLVVKLFGLVCALIGGLQVGKEGPLIHISSCIAQQLMETNLFKGIKRNPELSMQMLTAACATGVAANFGAPVGGVLFGIEVTAVYYQTRNYWKGFLSGILGALTFRVLLSKVDKLDGALAQTEFPLMHSYDISELILFTLFGVMIAFVSSLFIAVNRAFAEFQKAYKSAWFYSAKWPHALILGLVTGVVTFPGIFGSKMLNLKTSQQLIELYSEEDLEARVWGRDLIASLVMFCLAKFMLSAASVLMPLPAGVFAPSLVIGAGLGRLYGEIIRVLAPQLWEREIAVVAGGYAAVGSAAFAAGITHTISSAVIVLEITGQMEHILPGLLACVACVAVGGRLNLSVFDTLARLKGLPYFFPLKYKAHQALTARDAMATDIEVLGADATYPELRRIVHHMQSTGSFSIPLVKSASDMRLLGTIQIGDLEHHLREWELNHAKMFQFRRRNRCLRVFTKIGQISAKMCDAIASDQDWEHDFSFPMPTSPTFYNESTEMLRFEPPTPSSSSLSFPSSTTSLFSTASRRIDLTSEDRIRVDAAPFEMSPDMPLSLVFFYFSTLNLHEAVVTDWNRHFLGHISRHRILQFFSDH